MSLLCAERLDVSRPYSQREAFPITLQCGNRQSRRCVLVRAEGAVPPFCVYPSGAAYHTPCAVFRLTMATPGSKRTRRLKQILEDLNGVAADAKHVSSRGGSMEIVTKLQEELFHALQGGDPMNSEAIVDLIDVPLGSSRDTSEADSWLIVP